MSLFRAIGKAIKEIRNPERVLSERIFLLLTIIGELAVLISLVGDILTGEYLAEIVLLAVILILVPFITIICLYKNKLGVASRLITYGLVLFALPGIFFFGGGVEGGGVTWVIFGFLFAALVLSGRERNVIFIFLVVLYGGLFLTEYTHPEWVPQHTKGMFYVDTFIALVMVGIICFISVLFLNRLYMDENDRARKEAERAEELNRSQNRFFSSMSHEIRTPINSILGLNELILREENASDEIVKDANGIQGSGRMLLALINDILDFSKIEAGSMDIVPVNYNVGDLLSEIVNMIWQKAQDKGLTLDVSVDPTVPTALFGDEVRVKQILINLLNNAVKYTKEGSVGLHVECEEAENGEIQLRMSVTDTGMGIKKDSIPYLFDAFKRVDEAQNRHIEGTGLGLSIVKQLVDLMDGTISVDSVYGEGSSFHVMIRQGVADPTPVGELNIRNYGVARRSAYESSFVAPRARILIVDDNEMNLTVETKLLAATRIRVDTAISGRDALGLTVKNKYDVILMDHLMPEMDGIECLEAIRTQSGGLNTTTAVLVLTANAGSDNKQIYNRAGFDGYLLKPVSGDDLEVALIKHIPSDKVVLSAYHHQKGGEMSSTSGYKRKVPVVVTTSSMCDLPDEMMDNPYLPILPFNVHTEAGTFRDCYDMDPEELMRYFKSGKKAESAPPDPAAYVAFFLECLKYGHHLFYIAISSKLSEDYARAVEAAKSFDNVTIINSGSVSSTTGILTLIACKLAQQDVSVEDMIVELNAAADRLRCSFVVDRTDYLQAGGLIGRKVSDFARALDLRPAFSFRKEKSGLFGVWAGGRRHAYRRYIRKAFPVEIVPDPEICFITYADVPEETLLWIRDEISRYAYFENVIFQKASAAITSNCGPGCFGVLYFVRGNQTYNISSLIPGLAPAQNREEEELPAEAVHAEEHPAKEEPEKAEAKWYENIEGIDGALALKNSGSEDSLRTVIKIFYDSAPAKTGELEGFFGAGDWANYTIKIHALKSSAKLIGAMELSEAAQALELAGKSGDEAFLREHHTAFMEQYARFREVLAPLCGEEEVQEPETESGPPIDSYLLESAYDALADAAGMMDCDMIEEAIGELSGYSIPEADCEKIAKIRKMAANFEYDGILQLLGKM